MQAACAICEKPLTPREAAEGTICMMRACIAEQALRDERAEDAQREAENQQAADDFAAPRLEPGEFAARVPSAGLPLRPADREKQRSFRARLRGCLRDAALVDTTDRPPKSDHDASEAPELEAACTLCRGACCKTGANHAFLFGGFLSTVLQARADETPAQIYRDYVRRLPDESCEGACVYQGAMGCVLPRAMRSDICNTHECRLRGAFAAQMKAAPEKRALVVAVRDGKARAAARIAVGQPAQEIFRED